MSIIAEVGQNHCGNMGLAKELIRLAKQNGADLAKFQLYGHNMLYKDHPEIPNVELSFDQAKMLFDYGNEVGIEVFFSVFDLERVKWCEEIGVKRYKIASRDIDNWSLIFAIYLTGKEIIQSMPYGRMVNNSLLNPPISRIIYLYCVPEYPAIVSLRDVWFEEYNASTRTVGQIGFSDHSIGLDAAKIALARGAQIIEKHFSLDHHTGIDAEWSMTPDELKELKRWANVVETVL